jgi:hypothetical protein
MLAMGWKKFLPQAYLIEYKKAGPSLVALKVN